MRNLTERQAKNCEEARDPVCHCRCGGHFHGAKRGGDNASPEYYNTLPEDDPHYAPSKEQIAKRQKARQDAKRKERQDRIDTAWKKAQELLGLVHDAERREDYESRKLLRKQFLEAYREYEEIKKRK